MRLRNWLFGAVAVAAAVLLTGRAVTALVVDHAWYAAMGVPGLFWEQRTDTALLQGIAWLAGSLFAFANLHAVRLTILAVAVPSRLANIEGTFMLPPRRLLVITIILATLIGIALALPLSNWTSVALTRHGVPFNEIEGILFRDLGFYVYVLPLEETAYLWALSAILLLVMIVLLLYALTRSLRIEGRRVLASNHVRRHLSVLGALVLLLLAWSYRLDGFDVLQRGSGPDGLFARLDHVVILQVDRVLVVLCGIAAAIVLRAGWLSQLRSAFVTLSLVLVATIGGRHILPMALARSSVIGAPSKRDVPYVATRTLFSRRAYQVDGMRTVSAATPGVRIRLPLAELPAHLSLWEENALRTNADDRRGTNIDVGTAGWTQTAGGQLAALRVRRPAAGQDDWLLASADVTQASLRDSVLNLVGGARTDDHSSSIEPISAPGLRGHRLVVDPAGVLGTPMRSLGMRIAHAWAARDPALLESDSVSGPAPRLVRYRDVRERVARLAPVLVLGTGVQPILYDGALFWAITLYSAADRFPLSQRWTILGEQQSYFKLAATALVDAATGRVRFVAVDRPDPIARTWFKQISALMVSESDLPPGLLDQLPPASDGALAQARTFARYGSRLEGVVPRHFPDSALVGAMPPVHLVTGPSTATVAWSLPLLDVGDRIGGVITAVGGRFRSTYWDSTPVPRARWSDQTERLRAALDTARNSVTEGSRREPRTRLGRVQALSGENGPILVQTLIQNRADDAPLITRVAVLDDNRLAVGKSIVDAVAMLRGLPAAPRRVTGAPPLEGVDRDARIARLYDAMRDALRRGEWTRFGAALDSLGTLLGRPVR